MAAPDLVADELTLIGRITTASNATFLGQIGDVQVVYKPRDGESPLWDFPHHTLAGREVAAYRVSRVTGWNIVPRTLLRDGPFGEGMVQIWQEPQQGERAVDVIGADEEPGPEWKPVLQGQGAEGEIVTLVHEDSAALRRMALFDVVVNNADRKGDHILAMADGHRYGVDHGVTFHHEPKLRTVLWGWLGEELTGEEREGIARISEALTGELARELAELVSAEEVDALGARCEELLAAGTFPEPTPGMPAVPWPLF